MKRSATRVRGYGWSRALLQSHSERTDGAERYSSPTPSARMEQSAAPVRGYGWSRALLHPTPLPGSARRGSSDRRAPERACAARSVTALSRERAHAASMNTVSLRSWRPAPADAHAVVVVPPENSLRKRSSSHKHAKYA